MLGLFLGYCCLRWQRSKTEKGGNGHRDRWINTQPRCIFLLLLLLFNWSWNMSEATHKKNSGRVKRKPGMSDPAGTFPFTAVSKTRWKQQASSLAFFFFFFFFGEGLRGEQHSGVLGGAASSCPISPNLLFRGGGRRVEQPLNFHKGRAHPVFFKLCAKISQITPQINARLTPNTSFGM